MSISLDNQPHRLGRRWQPHVVAKVKADWDAGLPLKVIAKRLVASGIVITAPQIHNMARYHRFPLRVRHSTETVAQIRKLWGGGYSAGCIGKLLKLTRGQVMGIIDHRGFQRRTTDHFTMHDLDDERPDVHLSARS